MPQPPDAGAAHVQLRQPPTLDIGLALSGAVSGGAYTAGALDFIVQALDEWHCVGTTDTPAPGPPHMLRLAVLSGTSSGALTAAILASALAYRFPPAAGEAADAPQNPLFDSWVNMTDITHLLGHADVATGGVRSLLDPTRLNEAARKAVDFGVGLERAHRGWVARRLHVLCTVSLLSGVAFRRPSVGHEGSCARLHADVVRCNVRGLGVALDDVPGIAQRIASDCIACELPDEHKLALPDDPLQKWPAWQTLARAALASAAFPLALPARFVRGPASALRPPKVVLPEGGLRPPRVSVLRAEPAAQPVGAAEACQGWLAADGGVCGPRSPVALAREVLLGRDPLARLAGATEVAPFALLEIDAIAAEPGDAARTAEAGGAASANAARPADPRAAAPTVLGRLLRLLLQQLPWQPSDVAAYQEASTGVHFRLAPAGSGRHAGGTAGGFLGGFGGYLARDFRRHDFLLGRRDAQQFLAHDFFLSAEHPLFAHWPAALRAQHLDAQGRLPLVPLAAALRPDTADASAPVWPWGAAEALPLRSLLRRRLQVLWPAAFASRPWWQRGLAWLLGLVAVPLVAWIVARVVRTAVRAHDLGSGR